MSQVSPTASTLELHDIYSTQQFPSLKGSVATKYDIQPWPHLSDLPLNNNQDVQMLIGQDNPEAFKIEEVRFGDGGQTYAICYTLGWTISGPLKSDRRSVAVSNFIIGELSLDECVNQFWQLDHVPNVNPEGYSINDRKVVEHWDQTAEIVDNHYSLEIPFKQNPPNMPNNREIAEKRLRSLGNNLMKDEKKKEKYATEIKRLLTNSYAEEVDESKSERVYKVLHGISRITLFLT